MESLVRIHPIQILLPILAPAIHAQPRHHPLELVATELANDSLCRVAYAGVRWDALTLDASD